MSSNSPLTEPPKAATATTITTAMRLAMSPYSTAVAPRSPRAKSTWRPRNGALNRFMTQPFREQRQTLVATVLKRVLRFLPSNVTATMMTMAIRATMRPYSTAVAPRSLRSAAALT